MIIADIVGCLETVLKEASFKIGEARRKAILNEFRTTLVDALEVQTEEDNADITNRLTEEQLAEITKPELPPDQKAFVVPGKTKADVRRANRGVVVKDGDTLRSQKRN